MSEGVVRDSGVLDEVEAGYGRLTRLMSARSGKNKGETMYRVIVRGAIERRELEESASVREDDGSSGEGSYLRFSSTSQAVTLLTRRRVNGGSVGDDDQSISKITGRVDISIRRKY